MADPHEIHTREDLQQALRALYTEAGISYQGIAVAAGIGGGNTINDWMHGKTFPQWANLAPVLRVWGIAEADMGLWKAAHGRADADRRMRPGLPLAQSDPFVLEVHEMITAAGSGELPPLTPYVSRAHDHDLAAVVDLALSGTSGLAVLLGDSSTGKTRAMWEALAPLRAKGGWRLWHPPAARRGELSEQLSTVGPRTVVWLNETQRYFLPASAEERDRLAAELLAVLDHTRRKPVLILGTLWREHYDALCADPGSKTRKLFSPAVIKVPPKFTGTELAAMHAAAAGDARLALACKRAEDGQITQYLAGGPELIDFYENRASVTAQAVIEAAMDTVRMGHPNALPFALLRDIAAEYIDDTTWDTLETNWFEAALAETSHRCKGARGPITPIRARPLSSRTPRNHREDSEAEVPVYQLADYLDQYGRRRRSQSTPPFGFWKAATTHVRPEHQHTVGTAAWDRGLYREAAQLWKNATRHGEVAAAIALVVPLHTLFPDDQRPKGAAAAQATVRDPRMVIQLLDKLHEVGAYEQVQVLANRAATQIPLDNLNAVESVLHHLHQVGATEQVRVLANRAVTEAAVADPRGVSSLLHRLHQVGATEQVRVLANRAVTEIPRDRLPAVGWLLGSMQRGGVCEQMHLLANRAVTQIALDSPTDIAELLGQLHWIEAVGHIRTLLSRDPATHVTLDDQTATTTFLDTLSRVGAQEQIRILGQRAASEIPLDDPSELSKLLTGLLEVKAQESVRALVARSPAAVVAIDDLRGVGSLLNGLGQAGAEEQVTILADRAAELDDFSDLAGVAHLLDGLCNVGAKQQVQALVARDRVAQFAIDRRSALMTRGIYGLAHRRDLTIEKILNKVPDPVSLRRELLFLGGQPVPDWMQTYAARAVAHVAVDDPEKVWTLLDVLQDAGLRDHVRALLEHDPAAHVAIHDLAAVGILLQGLQDAGAEEQMGVLAERAASQFIFGVMSGAEVLLEGLRRVGADVQVEAVTALLSAAGRFDLFLATSPELKKQFTSGREPNGTPARPWRWDDLD